MIPSWVPTSRSSSGRWRRIQSGYSRSRRSLSRGRRLSSGTWTLTWRKTWVTKSRSTEDVFRGMDPPPPRSNGWWLLSWAEFQRQFDHLAAEVARLAKKDPTGYGSHPSAKLLAAIL